MDNKSKKSKKKKIIILSSFALLAILIVIGFQIKASFATASVAKVEEYMGTGRTSGKSIKEYESVKVDKLIPDDYSLNIANPNYFGSCKEDGGLNYGEGDFPTSVDKWVGVARDNIEFQNTLNLDYEGGTTVRADTQENINRSLPGGDLAKTLTCNNIGEYKGKSIGMKVSLIDLKRNNETDENHKAFLGFYTPDKSQRVGFYAANIDWLEVKYEFFEVTSNLIDESKPIEIKGNITYNDVDYEQGVHLLDNTDGIYIRNNTNLQYSEINGVPYVYSARTGSDEDEDGLHNPEVSFTELFSGQSLSRVYTFASSGGNVEDASGAMWNTDLVSGASIDYGDGGSAKSAVKKGDTVTYKVTFTNDDMDKANTITVKSVLSAGAEYVKGSAGSTFGDPTIDTDSSGTTTLMWEIDMEKNTMKTMSYKVKVVDGNTGILTNKTSIASTNGTEYKDLPVMKNSVPNKDYDTGSEGGKKGSAINPGKKMKYNVKYANVYDEQKTVTITETLSKYLEYVKSSSNLGEPVVTKESDGSTKLVWTRTLGPDTEETLTYEVRVSEDAKDKFKLSSVTTIEIEGTETIKLDALTNSVSVEKIVKKETKEKEYVPTKDSPGSLAILIKDSNSKRPVKGGKYILYNEDNETVAADVNGSYLQTKESDENGVVQWDQVPYGKYVLKEVENSSTFKSGFYESGTDKKKLINTIAFTFNKESDALKWFREGNSTGGTDSKEPYIERDNVKLGDINSDGEINLQDLTLMNAIVEGKIETTSEKEKIRYYVAADLNGDGKCNDGNCDITKEDSKLLEEYLNNRETEPFKAFKVVYLKDSYQKRAALSLVAIPLDLKINNIEMDTSKKIKGAKFEVKDGNETVYGNVDMDEEDKSIYLAPGTYSIKQEAAKEGYDLFEVPIIITMDSDGNVTLGEDYKSYVKIVKSDDGDVDLLQVYNILGENEVRVPYMQEDEEVVKEIVKQAAKVTGGGAMVAASAGAAAIRYGVSYKMVLAKLMGILK